MEILMILGAIGSACGVFGAIDLFLKWRKQLSRNSQSHLPKESGENQQEILASEVVNDAKSEISQRLYQLLDLLNQNRKNNRIKISELAEICGYENTSALEKYFLGLEEPINQEKEHICFCFGVNPKWLLHGKGEPFATQESYNFYAQDYLENIKSKLPNELIFVRSRSEEGSAGIVLRLNEFKYIFFSKTWYISDHVGEKGQKQIYSFYKLVKDLQNLQRTSCKFQYMNIRGNHLEEKDFVNLFCGAIYPGSIINFHNDTWWDDLTDINHTWACSPSYEQKYGQNFIKAQEIIKYLDK